MLNREIWYGCARRDAASIASYQKLRTSGLFMLTISLRRYTSRMTTQIIRPGRARNAICTKELIFASIDPETSARVDLFDPRRQAWHEHFHVGQDARIIGITPTGRATVRLLDMNGSPQWELRRELMEQGTSW
jgi:hypothetical protein